MSASKDLLLLLEDADNTIARMAASLAAARAVAELQAAPFIGNKAQRVVAQQLINETLTHAAALIDELTIITDQHMRENA